MALPIQAAKGIVYYTNGMQEIVVDNEVARVKIKIIKNKKAEIIMSRFEWDDMKEFKIMPASWGWTQNLDTQNDYDEGTAMDIDQVRKRLEGSTRICTKKSSW